MAQGTEMSSDDEIENKNETLGKREALKLLKRKQLISRNEERSKLRRIKAILLKEDCERDEEEREFLHMHSKVANDILKRKEKKRILDERKREKHDDPIAMQEKCNLLANAIKCSKHIVVYTGAGISTAASIPDYRGPNGIWTKLSRGEDFGAHNICDAEPTLTHMSLVALHQQGKVSHVVSQNCDGLHIRSGLPVLSLSEVHGNMFVEVCEKCEPQRVYWRLFDVTENTGLRRHNTGRKCKFCHRTLTDSIVHFGEKRELSFPQHWEAAFHHSKEADMILCLGSSLKVLKSYHALWGMNKAKQRRPSLFIVNLQWTPKDGVATLKINAKVDDVFELVMKKLGYEIPKYQRLEDPLFKLQVPLTRFEIKSHTTNFLTIKQENVEEDATMEHCKCDDFHVKGEPSEKSRVLDSCGEKFDSDKFAVLRPGWFGKGLRKIRKKRKKGIRLSSLGSITFKAE